MNNAINNFPQYNNINNNVNQIQNLIQNGYFKTNQNNKFTLNNSYNIKENELNIIKENSLKNNVSKPFKKLDNIKKKNVSNNRKKILNNKNNNNINKKRLSNLPSKIQENEYIFTLAMNNLNKYKDNLIQENNSQISNQINNKKFTNNIINYCLINPNNSVKEKNDNFLYDFENERVFPQPEPSPIKISKSSKNINQLKNFSLKLNPNLQRNNSNNYFNNNYNGYDLINYLNNENIQNDYYLGNNLNANYNKTSANEKNEIYFNNNIYEKNINSGNTNYNNNNISNDNDSKLMFILNNLNLSYLINVFKNNYINFDDLFFLTREDLVEMKIPIGPRNKLIHFIAEYKKHMKNFEFEELSNYFLYYNNNNSKKQEQKIIENNVPSTTQTTNEFSYRIKGNSNTNDFKLKEKQELVFHNYLNNNRNNNIGNYNNKENYNMSKNCSLLSSSYNCLKTSLEKNNINIKKRNSSCLINLKTSSYFNSKKIKINKNNEKIISSCNKDEKFNKDKKEVCSKLYNKINNFKKNTNRSRTNNNNRFYLRNSLMKLIEDSQTDKTFKENSTTSGQLVNQSNYNLTNNYQQDMNYYDNKPKFSNNIIKLNKINTKKKNVKQYYKQNKTKSNIANLKMKSNNNNKSKILNNKIVENFKNLNNEVENFQNNYKKLKKLSCDRENKLKNLLMADRHSSSKIKYLKQQLKNLNFNLEDLRSEYEKDLNSELDIKKNNKNLVLKNICQNRNNIISHTKKDINNNKNNTLIYELNMENN